MKKQTITKIAILFSAGLFGSMTAMYSISSMNVPMGITIPMLIVSILLVAVSMQWLEKELKKIIK
jgi:ABC-type sulfate transport system permease component